MFKTYIFIYSCNSRWSVYKELLDYGYIYIKYRHSLKYEILGIKNNYLYTLNNQNKKGIITKWCINISGHIFAVKQQRRAR